MTNEKYTRTTWTVREFAEEIGVSLPTAYNMTEEPNFPLFRVGRKKLVIVSGVERWLAERSATRAR